MNPSSGSSTRGNLNNPGSNNTTLSNNPSWQIRDFGSQVVGKLSNQASVIKELENKVAHLTTTLFEERLSRPHNLETEKAKWCEEKQKEIDRTRVEYEQQLANIKHTHTKEIKQIRAKHMEDLQLYKQQAESEHNEEIAQYRYNYLSV